MLPTSKWTVLLVGDFPQTAGAGNVLLVISFRSSWLDELQAGASNGPSCSIDLLAASWQEQDVSMLLLHIMGFVLP